MWICVVLEIWSAVGAGSASGSSCGLSPASGTFLGACAPAPATRTGIASALKTQQCPHITPQIPAGAPSVRPTATSAGHLHQVL